MEFDMPRTLEADENVRGKFRGGRRTFNTFIKLLSKGEAPLDDPENHLTGLERRELFQPSRSAPLSGLGSKQSKDKMLAKESEDRRRKGR